MFVIVVELQLRNNDYECFTSAILWLVLTLKIPEFLTRFCLYQYIDEHKFLPNVLAVRMSHVRTSTTSEGCGFDSRLGLRNILLSLRVASSLQSQLGNFQFMVSVSNLCSYINKNQPLQLSQLC